MAGRSPPGPPGPPGRWANARDSISDKLSNKHAMFNERRRVEDGCIRWYKTSDRGICLMRTDGRQISVNSDPRPMVLYHHPSVDLSKRIALIFDLHDHPSIGLSFASRQRWIHVEYMYIRWIVANAEPVRWIQ